MILKNQIFYLIIKKSNILFDFLDLKDIDFIL